MKNHHITTPETRAHVFPAELRTRCVRRMMDEARQQVAAVAQERANRDILGLLVADGHAKGIC